MEIEITCQDVLVVRTLSTSTPRMGILEHMRKISAAIKSSGGTASGLELPNAYKCIPCVNGNSYVHIGDIAVISQENLESRRLLASFTRRTDYGHETSEQILGGGTLRAGNGDTDPTSFHGNLTITEPLAIVSKVKSRMSQELVSEIAYWRDELRNGAVSTAVAVRNLFYSTAHEAFSSHRHRVLELVDSDADKKHGVRANWYDKYYVYPEATPETNTYLYHGFEPYSLACLPPSCVALLLPDAPNPDSCTIHFEDEFMM